MLARRGGTAVCLRYRSDARTATMTRHRYRPLSRDPPVIRANHGVSARPCHRRRARYPVAGRGRSPCSRIQRSRHRGRGEQPASGYAAQPHSIALVERARGGNHAHRTGGHDCGRQRRRHHRCSTHPCVSSHHSLSPRGAPPSPLPLPQVLGFFSGLCWNCTSNGPSPESRIK